MYDLETSGKQEHRQNSSYDVTRNTGILRQYIHTPGNYGDGSTWEHSWN